MLGFDCVECDEQLQKERGCNEKGIIPFYSEGQPSFRCPIKQVTEVSWQLLRAHYFFNKRLLPHGNGWLEESNKFLDAMILLDKEYSQYEQRRLKELRGNKNG